ncbi:MAG: chorismate synthase [Ignavibacteriales bacterium]|nr:chorismate synthase [Ignavibacteriales bacterium]
MRFLTAGESHGKGLIVIIDGLPSGIPITQEYINNHLRRRQLGYGRGLRMKMETDTAEIISGLRFGKTTGSPVSLIIRNKDWENWTDKMAAFGSPENIERVTIPRPGHADLVGTVKYRYNDIRNSIDRSSARETAARVAACTFARRMLEELGIQVGSFVENIGGVYPKKKWYSILLQNKLKNPLQSLSDLAEKSEVRALDKNTEKRMIEKIKWAKKAGTTLGGTFVVFAEGVPTGLGTFAEYDRRLDAAIAHAIMSIHAVKGVEIGMGFGAADIDGSKVHDEIILNNNAFCRKTNRAGGIEGGISNGMPILLRGAMKPIATLMNPLQSINLSGLDTVESRRERSDFTAVPACGVIAESMLAWVLAVHILEKHGGDSLSELVSNITTFNNNILNNIQNDF